MQKCDFGFIVLIISRIFMFFLNLFFCWRKYAAYSNKIIRFINCFGFDFKYICFIYLNYIKYIVYNISMKHMYQGLIPLSSLSKLVSILFINNIHILYIIHYSYSQCVEPTRDMNVHVIQTMYLKSMQTK